MAMVTKGYKLYNLKEGVVLSEFLTAHPEFRAVKGKKPGMRSLEKWSYDGVAKATDGCRVEPDGHCPHGCYSWLMVLGFI